MQPTEEQQAVIDACVSGENLKVEAGAGAGKTSTLREASGQMLAKLNRRSPTSSKRSRVLYVVYNRAAANEAKRTFPQGVRASTIHALAYGAVGRLYDGRRNSPRLPSKEIARRLCVRNPVELGPTVRLTPAAIAMHAVLTVQQFCYSADPEIGVQHVPALHGMNSTGDLAEMYVEWLRLRGTDRQQAAELRSLWDAEMRLRRDLAAVVLPVAQRAWEDAQDPHGDRIRYVPDYYLKMWQLTEPRLDYDVVMLDEAQDSNPVTASVLKRQQGQLIAIGDGNQQLYGWRGARDALKNWPAERTLTLSQSFRFGPEVAVEANKWLQVLGAKLRIRGNPVLASKVGPIDVPDAVLCRTNGGAISELLAALDDNRRPAIAGDGAGELSAQVRAAEQLMAGQPAEHPELYLFTSWGQVQEHAEEATGSDLRVFVELVDKHGPAALLKALARVTTSELADVVISTAHKSKGLEWPAVRICDDFPEPKIEGGRLGAIPRADAMLAYVATTRAGKVGLDPSGLAWIDHYLPMRGAA